MKINTDVKNVGDLVFLLDKKNNPIPAKIERIENDIYYFEPIIDDIPIPFTEMEIIKCGYNGGKVFSTKQNAIDYLEVVKKLGKFDLQYMMQLKMKRNLKQNMKQPVQEHSDDNTKDIAMYVINAMLLAMNSELKIGPTRAAKVVNKTTELMNNYTKEEIFAMAESKMLL